jgi:hypothetical protein
MFCLLAEAVARHRGLPPCRAGWVAAAAELSLVLLAIVAHATRYGVVSFSW